MRWWSSVAAGNGTSTAGRPAAASSASVVAPARQTTRSAALISRGDADRERLPPAPRRRRARRPSRTAARSRSPVWCTMSRPPDAPCQLRRRRHHGHVDGVRALRAAKDQHPRRRARPPIVDRSALASKNSARTGLPATNALSAKVRQRLVVGHRRRAHPRARAADWSSPARRSARAPSSGCRAAPRRARPAPSCTRRRQSRRAAGAARRGATRRRGRAARAARRAAAPRATCPSVRRSESTSSANPSLRHDRALRGRAPSRQTSRWASGTRRRSSRATAIPGYRCPPVPPPAITTDNVRPHAARPRAIHARSAIVPVDVHRRAPAADRGRGAATPAARCSAGCPSRPD